MTFMYTSIGHGMTFNIEQNSHCIVSYSYSTPIISHDMAFNIEQNPHSIVSNNNQTDMTIVHVLEM